MNVVLQPQTSAATAYVKIPLETSSVIATKASERSPQCKLAWTSTNAEKFQVQTFWNNDKVKYLK